MRLHTIMHIKYSFILILVSIILTPTSIYASTDFQNNPKESSSNKEIPELKRRNPQSLKDFKNQAEPEDMPPRSIDPIQGNCDVNKLTDKCKKSDSRN